MEIITRSYECSFGQRPRGRGNWAFRFDFRSPRNTETHWFNELYSEARKLAIAFAKKEGAFRIEVLP